MKRNILLLKTLLLAMMTGIIGCSKGTMAQPPAPVTVASHSPNVPVIKGIPANPILRMAIHIPSGHAGKTFKTIRGSLNATAISAIQRIDLYLTGAEPFTTANRIASVQPSASTFDLPVDLKLPPGVHFLWFSVVMKDEAAIDGKIDLRCTSFKDAAGKVVDVSHDLTETAKRIGVAVRKGGDDKVNTYRIPGIVTTDKGTLLAVYDIRYLNSTDLPGHIDVGLSRSTDGGRTWAPMRIIMDMGAPHENNGVGDPAILFDPVTRKIWVAALWSKGNRSIAGSLPGMSPDTTGQFALVSSEDDGLTWTTPYTITPQVKNPAWHLFFVGPGNGIAMQDGTLVFASQYWDEKKMPHSTIIHSKDNGRTWTGKILGPKSNTTESQVVETVPGTLMLNMRDNRGGFRSVATTTDLGGRWTEHPTSYNALPDPVCMASLIKASVITDGIRREVLFFSNPNTSSGRYNITVKASLDMGQTWQPVHHLPIDQRTGYGYSSLTRIDEHTIGLLYEGVKDLYFVRIPVNEIIKK
jgi:sialidase-1